VRDYWVGYLPNAALVLSVAASQAAMKCGPVFGFPNSTQSAKVEVTKVASQRQGYGEINADFPLLGLAIG